MTLTLPFFDSSAFNFSDASHYTIEKNYKTPNFIASCSGGLIDRCQDATKRDGKTGWEEREQKRGEREGLIVDAIGNFLRFTSLTHLSLSHASSLTRLPPINLIIKLLWLSLFLLNRFVSPLSSPLHLSYPLNQMISLIYFNLIHCYPSYDSHSPIF
jgi:hypothetical protein